MICYVALENWETLSNADSLTICCGCRRPRIQSFKVQVMPMDRHVAHGEPRRWFQLPSRLQRPAVAQTSAASTAARAARPLQEGQRSQEARTGEDGPGDRRGRPRGQAMTPRTGEDSPAQQRRPVGGPSLMGKVSWWFCEPRVSRWALVALISVYSVASERFWFPLIQSLLSGLRKVLCVLVPFNLK